MKHIEELKIGVTAILFCLIMLLVYGIFPKDGFVPSTKAPMPEIPSSDNWEEEDNYGFQIYTQESNYNYQEPSSQETDSQEPVPEGSDIPQTDPAETVPPEETTDPETPADPSVAEDSYPEEPSDDSFVEEPSEDTSYEDSSYEDSSYEDEFNWDENEETYPPES